MDVTAMGRAGLTGWRAKVVPRVAEPVSSAVPLSAEQVEALIGGIFLLLSAWQFYKLFRRVWRAGRGEQVED